MLRELHDATTGFSPPTAAVWQDWWGRGLGDHSRAFGHGDLRPWNIMAIDGTPTGFIDWERAGPVDPIWELAQVGWLNAQLHDDDIAERLGLGDTAPGANNSHSCSMLTGLTGSTPSVASRQKSLKVARVTPTPEFRRSKLHSCSTSTAPGRIRSCPKPSRAAEDGLRGNP